MTDFWMSLWTYIWFISLGVFSILSILVIIFGGYDLGALLQSLRRRHLEATTTEEEIYLEEPAIPPAPPAP
ncbi:hypothetical protein LLH23_04700 [bacterium]|nr:hypothetical protein [bacterium]